MARLALWAISLLSLAGGVLSHEAMRREVELQLPVCAVRLARMSGWHMTGQLTDAHERIGGLLPISTISVELLRS
jgi:hypothetical protein